MSSPPLHSHAPTQRVSSGSVPTLTSRPSHPIPDPSASKRVCFYRSGDPKFSGHRMVINGRTFKTFDALLDALSKKVPLPFGVRTISTPRGIHSVRGLEDLHDGGSYVCSDQRRVKPLNLAAVHRRKLPWNTTRPPNTGRRRRNGRPNGRPNGRQNEGDYKAVKITDRVLVRTPRRLAVVKNRDPTVKHTVVLQKRTAPTFDALLDYLSQVMQFPVLKLYSPDGRRAEPPHACILPQEEDIEKSFRVNQDGSMTVEMKVRLTIKEEELLHWTTTLSRSSLNHKTACASKSRTGNSSPDSNNTIAKDYSSICDDTSKEDHPAVGFSEHAEGEIDEDIEKQETDIDETERRGEEEGNTTGAGQDTNKGIIEVKNEEEEWCEQSIDETKHDEGRNKTGQLAEARAEIGEVEEDKQDVVEEKETECVDDEFEMGGPIQEEVLGEEDRISEGEENTGESTEQQGEGDADEKETGEESDAESNRNDDEEEEDNEDTMPDNRVHPEGDATVVAQARRPPSGAGRALQAQDSVDALHVRYTPGTHVLVTPEVKTNRLGCQVDVP
ncbi:hypothetical protein CRUP_036251 [Coryphaenoides rupestris]|nr:hypothetical protein CRUP_036251 [Coryphaenoides rupestris]